MKFILKILSSIVCAVILLSVTSCDKGNFTYDFYAFNTNISIVCSGEKLSESAQNEISNLLISIEKDYSVTRESSFVYKLNESDKNVPVKIDDSAKEIIRLCKEVNVFTDNKFNPAIYPLTKLWHFSPMIDNKDFILPDSEDVNGILSSGCLNIENIKVSGDTVYKLDENSKIDFGGILKGYAVDRIDEILQKNNIKKGYVNIGESSIKAKQIGGFSIKHPLSTNNELIRVKLDETTDSCISTSGNYNKNYILDGKIYSHIIDQKTGSPYDTGIISATIISNSATICDALSTAICLCDFNENDNSNELFTFINKIEEKYDDSVIFAVYSKNQKKYIITNSDKGNYTLSDSSFSVINVK